MVRLENHKKWGVAGGLGALRIRFRGKQGKIRPVLGFGVVQHQRPSIGVIFGHFWTFHRHIVAHVACSHCFPSLSVLPGLRGNFGPRKAGLGHKRPSFGRAPPDLAPPPVGATGEFLARKFDFTRLAPRL